MPEPKSASNDTMTSASVAAVMPCVGGLIFLLGQNGTEARVGHEAQSSIEAGWTEDATSAVPECVE
jgi:hypothetical protein